MTVRSDGKAPKADHEARRTGRAWRAAGREYPTVTWVDGIPIPSAPDIDVMLVADLQHGWTQQEREIEWGGLLGKGRAMFRSGKPCPVLPFGAADVGEAIAIVEQTAGLRVGWLKAEQQASDEERAGAQERRSLEEARRTAEGRVQPPAERDQHVGAEPEAALYDTPRVDQDEAGRVIGTSSGKNAPDTLQIMFRRNTIDARQLEAGRRFQATFKRAKMDPLKAADYARQKVQGDRELIVDQIEDAKQQVSAVLTLFGGSVTDGLTNASGSLLWHVLGMGMSVKEWASRERHGERKIHPDVASAYLSGALSVLVFFYGLDRQTQQKLRRSGGQHAAPDETRDRDRADFPEQGASQ